MNKYLTLLCACLLTAPLQAQVKSQTIHFHRIGLTEWMESSNPHVDILLSYDGSGYGLKLEMMREVLALSGARNLGESLDIAQKSLDSKDPEALYLYAQHLKFALGVEYDAGQVRACLALAAKLGHVKAQHELARLYLMGLHAERIDTAIAMGFDLLHQTAEQGLVAAHLDLGCLYLNKRDEDHYNLDLGLQFMQKAADLASLEAQRALGVLFWEGEDVPQDEAAATKYWEMAAQQGDALSSACLAVIYDKTQPERAAECKAAAVEAAQQWYIFIEASLAAQKLLWEDKECLAALRELGEDAPASALYARALCYERGLGGINAYKLAQRYMQQAAEKSFLPAQLHMAYRSCGQDDFRLAYGDMSLILAARAAKSGDAKAQLLLGLHYLGDEEDLFAKPDFEKALYWLKSAAEQGNSRALYVLGTLAQKGRALPKDAAVAQAYFQRGAEAGSLPAMHYLATMLLEEDAKLAFSWYKKAADAGYIPAQVVLGKAMMSGEGLQKNEARGVYYFEIAAELGDVQAAEWLGYAYYHGKGVPQDKKKGLYWYLKASMAEADSAPANAALGHIFYQGEGVPVDKIKAEYFFKKSVEAGGEGQRELIYIYLDGAIPELQNLPQARKLLRAYETESDGDLYALSLKLPYLLSGKQKPFARYEEAELQALQQRAQEGDAAAQLSLGIIAEYGMSGAPDSQKALASYQAAMAQSPEQGALYAGLMASQPEAERMAHLTQALQAGSVEAAYALSFLKATDQQKLLEQAAQGGIVPALCLLQKKGGEKAFAYCQVLADKGYALYQKKLGDYYREGTSCEPDRTKAMQCYDKAVMQREPSAMQALAQCYQEQENWEKAASLYKSAYLITKDKQTRQAYERVLEKIYAKEMEGKGNKDDYPRGFFIQ